MRPLGTAELPLEIREKIIELSKPNHYPSGEEVGRITGCSGRTVILLRKQFELKKRNICSYCRKIFWTYRSDRKFCSRKCYQKSLRVPPIKIECINCGKTFFGRKGRKYCSTRCRNDFFRKKRYNANPTFPKICANCGKPFNARNRNTIFCCKKCQEVGRRQRHSYKNKIRSLREFLAEKYPNILKEFFCLVNHKEIFTSRERKIVEESSTVNNWASNKKLGTILGVTSQSIINFRRRNMLRYKDISSELRITICKNCHKKFIKKKPTQEFCSTKCYKHFWYKTK